MSGIVKGYQISTYQRYMLYFSIAGLLYLIFLIIAVLNPSPNLTYPTARPQIEPPEFDFNIDFDGSETVQTIFYIVTGLVLAFLLYQLMKYGSNIVSNRKKMVKDQEVISPKEAEKRLKDARTRAYVILNNSLASSNYTEGYIEAYQILDEDLDFFREIARPKFYTPKEYAFSVKNPVFKPAVYQFVKIFYGIRYGGAKATEDNIITFISSLDNLFEKDVDRAVKLTMEDEFLVEIKSVNQLHIPYNNDPTKPRRDDNG
jgi:hypothetical protein